MKSLTIEIEPEEAQVMLQSKEHRRDELRLLLSKTEAQIRDLRAFLTETPQSRKATDAIQTQLAEPPTNAHGKLVKVPPPEAVASYLKSLNGVSASNREIEKATGVSYISVYRATKSLGYAGKVKAHSGRFAWTQ